MKEQKYLFDTHSLIFWVTRNSVSKRFLEFFDEQDQQGQVLVSSLSFWEISLLVKKRKLEISDVLTWKTELFNNTNLILIEPTSAEMINSTLLPDYHKDPFDRLLIVQSLQNKAIFVTKDQTIPQYDVETFWI